MLFPKAALYAGACAILLAACSEPAPSGKAASSATQTPATPAPMAANGPPPEVVTHDQPVERQAIEASVSLVARPIDMAVWQASPPSPQARRDAMIRAQVLLARAHFSPGVIAGQDGGNVKNAIAAFEAAHDLPVDGVMDPAVWAALAKDEQPAVTDYIITPEDVKGPFLAAIPTDYKEMAKLPALGFTSASEALAEKFHMDEALLKALNPGVDLATPGARIVVAALGPDKLPATVTRIEVDKTRRQVRAYGDGDLLLAVYPATVGSSERPAPAGEWAVRATAPNPTYTYDPSRLTFGKAAQGKLTIKAGPNNPVGGTWIDLTKDTFGIHGSPDPEIIGKRQSHGCVRLTNWDAAELGKAVTKGVEVSFVGVERGAKPA